LRPFPGGGEQGGDLVGLEERHVGLAEALLRDGQDLGDELSMFRMAQDGMANSDRKAARRALRLRALLSRSASRWSRNAEITPASRSSHSSMEGAAGWARAGSSSHPLGLLETGGSQGEQFGAAERYQYV
jgi:hypothetical protein